jgi:enoyl-[acyl-carrier protein] reductase I
MDGLLKGKRGIIFGALDEKSMAWHIAEKVVEHGAKITLSNTAMAIRFGKVKELGQKLNAEVIPADATNIDDLEQVFTKSMDVLGGKIDFVLHSIGMSLNIRKKRPYTDVNYDFYMKTLDISAISFHKIIQTAYKLDAMNEWGSIVAITYIAAQRTFDRYNDMADAKALLESIARSWGYYYGKKRKVRINTVSQSPTPTTAGQGIDGFDVFYQYADKLSPLGNADADDLANYVVTLFSDLTRKVTMQNLYHDGGFSSMGMSDELMQEISNKLNKD